MKNVYLYRGNEELIIKNKIEVLLSQLKKGTYSKTIYDMDEYSLNEAVNDALTIPFLVEKKVVIVRNPRFLGKGSIEERHNIPFFLRYLKDPSDFTIFIIDATNIEIDEKKDVFKEIQKAAEISDTRNLSDIEMKGWLRRQFDIAGIEIEDNAIELFFDYVGYDLIKAKSEVEKVINYVTPRKVVSIRDISVVVSDGGETDVFELTKAINKKDKSAIITIYNSLIRNGNDQIKLMSLIYRSFKDIYAILLLLESGVNKGEIANKLGISSGRAYYLTKDAEGFKIENVEKILNDIGELDYKIKTGKLDKATGLELLLFGL